MRTTKSKLLLLLVMLALLVAMLWLSLKAYSSYAEYTRGQDKINYTVLMNKTSTLLEKIGEEEAESVDQISNINKTEDGTQGVRESRVATDEIMADIIDMISKDGNLKSYKRYFVQIKEALNYSRSKVDTLSVDYKNIFIDSYYQNVSKSISQVLKETRDKFDSEEMKSILDTHISLSQSYANSIAERSAVALFLGKQLPMSDTDLALWESILSQDVFPDISKHKKEKIFPTISKLINDSNTNDKIFADRVSIARGAMSGKYAIDKQQAVDDFSLKLNNTKEASSILLTDLSSIFLSEKERLRSRAIQYSLAALLSLLFLIVFYIIYKNIGDDKRLLEEALSKIEKVLSEDKKNELKSIVDRKETAEIYNFLADTIMESNKAKDLFLANMSHEIRTPLNGVVGFTQILKTTALDKDQEEYVQIIEDSSENLLTIVNDILDLSKIKAEKIDFEEIPFDPLKKFESAVEIYGAKALQKDIDFGVFVDPSLPSSIMGDPTRISQVLVNLVSNAIKFTGTYGEVSVFCEPTHKQDDEITIRFSVKDSGIGITAAQKKRIFEEFTQADSSTTRNYGGTGLGLSISYKLVEAMGGELDIESEVGVGTTFFFSLNFKINNQAKKRDKPNFFDTSVGLLLPKRNITRQVDKNIEMYMRHMSANYRVYFEDEIFTLSKNQLPEILFVDQRYARRENEVKKVLNIDTQIVFLVDGNKKRVLDELETKATKLIHKPLNYSKVYGVLEALKSDTSHSDNESGSDEPKVSFSNIRVLVAEDNAINQKLITTTLNNYGVDVSIAANGEEALMLRKENEYDLIFMDIQMPVMNGIEATREILKFERNSKSNHIPIIALTANALSGDREKYLQAGMDDYTPKPLNIELIGSIIQKYCPQKQLFKQKPEATTVAITKDEKILDAIPERPIEDNSVDSNSNQEMEAGRALIYLENELTSRIQERVLIRAGYELDVAENDIDFLNKIDIGEYDFVFISSDLLQTDDCYSVDLIVQKGIQVYIYDSNFERTCANADTYISIADILGI